MCYCDYCREHTSPSPGPSFLKVIWWEYIISMFETLRLRASVWQLLVSIELKNQKLYWFSSLVTRPNVLAHIFNYFLEFLETFLLMFLMMIFVHPFSNYAPSAITKSASPSIVSNLLHNSFLIRSSYFITFDNLTVGRVQWSACCRLHPFTDTVYVYV